MMLTADKLAIDGGPKVRQAPFPKRSLFGEAEKQAAAAVFDEAIRTGDAFLYNGPEEEAYRREFADYLGGGFVHTVNSGTNALYAVLGGLQLDPGSEVVAPPITDPGGIMPIPLLNCVPIIADAEPGFYHFGPDELREVLSPRTRAIVVAHIAGSPADMDPIMEIARTWRVPVIEDCAQAHGARYKGRLLGTIGDYSIFSMMSGKHHATGAQGGAVFTRDEDAYWRIKRFADRGKPYNLEGVQNVVAGLNLNLNDLAAAIGRVQLRKLDAMVAARRRVAARIAKSISGARAVAMAREVTGAEPTYWFLRIRLQTAKLKADWKTFIAALVAEGIPASNTYRDRTLHGEAEWLLQRRVFGKSGYPWTCPAYTGDPGREFPCPNAIQALESHLHISIHEKFSDEDATDVGRALLKVENAFLA